MEWGFNLIQDFDELGFLGKQIDGLMKPTIIRYQAYYNLIENLSKFANEIRYLMNVNSENGREILASLLFIKVSNTFQAIVLLSKKGLAVECAILTRSLLEVVFPLKILSLEENFAQEFALIDKVKQLKLMNVILKDKELFSSLISQSQITEEDRDKLKKEITINGIRDFSVEELAKRANMYSFYQLAYRCLSEEVHTTGRSLKSYVITDENGEIKMFENGPQVFDLHKFNTASYCLLIAIDCINEIFNLKLEQEIKQYEEKITNLEY
jgi:hypothetical protein